MFKGTRVPVQALLDHLEAGDSLDVFLNSFPSVTREQTIAFLEMAKEAAEGRGHWKGPRSALQGFSHRHPGAGYRFLGNGEGGLWAKLRLLA